MSVTISMTEYEYNSLRRIRENSEIGKDCYMGDVDSILRKYDNAKEVMDAIEVEFNFQCERYPGFNRQELRNKARRFVMAQRKQKRRTENDR